MQEPTTTASLVAGYLSIGCWLIVFTPQIYQNWKRKSTTGLSALFIWIWLIADICSILGATFHSLLPTIIGLSFYYAVVEVIMLVQMWYYAREPTSSVSTAKGDSLSERTPLLSAGTSTPTSTAATATTATKLCIVAGFVMLNVFHSSGAAGSGFGEPNAGAARVWSDDVGASGGHARQLVLLADVLGYVSAILYIGARVPQIYLNHVSRSCAGLSLLMFAFSVIGNTTYVASIFLQSTDATWLAVNAPWIAGSAGTLVFDFVVLGQFYAFRSRADEETAVDQEKGTVDGLNGDFQ
ncbi:hypothetical protein HKX48_006671 [Thoreauomyces humboldtii]|nr:hypothetical protein HKX48_006671 [Thoreauomyces humboldtii]